jgi:hypothetical protein
VLIDATKPPLNAPDARRQFERIRLEDFIA